MNLPGRLCGLLLMLLPVVGCGSDSVTENLPAAGQSADLVLLHGKICTMDAGRSWASALAVRGGRIAYVGSDEGARVLQGSSTRVLDLQGRMVLPGLHDTHVHLVEGGVVALQCSLVGLTSAQQIYDRVADYSQDHPELEWIIGGGWEATLFPPAGPTRQELDAVVSDRPVVLYGADGHSAWLNSRALEASGITRDTPQPAFGRIEKDADGEPTGTLREDAVELAVEKAPQPDRETYAKAATGALDEAHRLGLTSFQDANTTPSVLQAYVDLEARGQLSARVLTALETRPSLGPSQVTRMVADRERASTRRLQVRAAKIFVDGVVESRTAALLEPYVGTTDRGPLRASPEEMQRLVSALAEARFTVHFHAIGDRAVRVALDSLQAAPAGGDLRHCIAHNELVDPQDVPRFRQLGALVSFQPRWAYYEDSLKTLTVPILGPERSSRIYPMGTMARSGALIAAGSDWPVSQLSPWDGIQVAVTRRGPDEGPGEAWLPDERLSLWEALAAYTINGAYVLGQERQTGSLEAGKYADLVVLDRNLFEIAPEQISKVRVLRTFLEGQEVWSASEAPHSRQLAPALSWRGHCSCGQ